MVLMELHVFTSTVAKLFTFLQLLGNYGVIYDEENSGETRDSVRGYNVEHVSYNPHATFSSYWVSVKPGLCTACGLRLIWT